MRAAVEGGHGVTDNMLFAITVGDGGSPFLRRGVEKMIFRATTAANQDLNGEGREI